MPTSRSASDDLGQDPEVFERGQNGSRFWLKGRLGGVVAARRRLPVYRAAPAGGANLQRMSEYPAGDEAYRPGRRIPGRPARRRLRLRPSTTPTYRVAVVDLLGGLAYSELTAFERLTEDATTAPTLEDKAALASMAVAEFGHFERLRDRLQRARGRPVRGDGAVPCAGRRVPRAHRAVGLAREPDQGLRRRRARRGLLPRDRRLSRRRRPAT